MNNMIGNTPLLIINYKYKGEDRVIYAKAEYYNLTGSIKDRIAKHIIYESYKDGTLSRNMPIVEATSGNTGIAFAALGAMYGHPVHIFMPEWMSNERKQIIKGYGAILHEVTYEQGGFAGCVEIADAYAKEIGGFRPQQFLNPYNVEAHYLTTGLEICAQLEKLGVPPHCFVAGVGTGGTIMGVKKRLKRKFPDVKIFPLEPAQSAFMTTGNPGTRHRIQGIGDGFIPEIVKMSELDEVLVVDDGDAILMAHLLAKKLGLGVGVSSGANFIGAVLAQNKYGKDSNTITIFSDDVKKYLSAESDLNEQPKPGFISNDIELICVDAECICDKRTINGICDTFQTISNLH